MISPEQKNVRVVNSASSIVPARKLPDENVKVPTCHNRSSSECTRYQCLSDNTISTNYSYSSITTTTESELCEKSDMNVVNHVLEERSLLPDANNVNYTPDMIPTFAGITNEQDNLLNCDISDNGAVNDKHGNTITSNQWQSKHNSNSIVQFTYKMISNKIYQLNCLALLGIVVVLLVIAYSTRGYAELLLLWIGKQNPCLIFAVFILLFTIVSFPFVFGYFILKITTGYLFGFILGLLTVIIGANVGVVIAHVILTNLKHHIFCHKIIKNETGRAILRVISGPRAFRVVLFTRLTPIPFGIQNAIFGVSSINTRIYHLGTFIGLLPAQIINVYLGSTLRSMHEVLSNRGSAAWTGYVSFGVEVICGVVLMFWVIQKARKELTEALNVDMEHDAKLIDIQV